MFVFYEGFSAADSTSVLVVVLQVLSAFVCPCSLGVVRNLLSFFQLRCCGFFKPTVIDWTQQFPPGRDQHVFGHPDLV